MFAGGVNSADQGERVLGHIVFRGPAQVRASARGAKRKDPSWAPPSPPHLHFHGNAAEAMATYGAIFVGSPDIVTFGQFGQADPALAGQVMH